MPRPGVCPTKAKRPYRQTHTKDNGHQIGCGAPLAIRATRPNTKNTAETATSRKTCCVCLQVDINPQLTTPTAGTPTLLPTRGPRQVTATQSPTTQANLHIAREAHTVGKELGKSVRAVGPEPSQPERVTTVLSRLRAPTAQLRPAERLKRPVVVVSQASARPRSRTIPLGSAGKHSKQSGRPQMHVLAAAPSPSPGTTAL